jgi:hypothetical protein
VGWRSCKLFTAILLIASTLPSHRSSFLITPSLSLRYVCIRFYFVVLVNIDPSKGPEIWNVSDGRIIHQGKTAVVEESFADARSPKGSGTNTPIRSRLQTPVGSTHGTPVGSAAEDNALGKTVIKKKKKLTRNQLKAQEERRRLRKLRWLQVGGPRPEDTDSDTEPQ